MYLNIKDKESNNSYEFKRLEIVKSINGEIKETDVSMFLPLFYEDSINLYGYHFYLNEKYLTTIFYLNNSNDNRVISPYDIRFTELFSMKKKLIQRIISSYKFISGNCPNFHKWLDEEFYNQLKNSYNKEFRKYFKALKKEIKEGKKKLESEKEKLEFEQQKWTEMHMKNF